MLLILVTGYTNSFSISGVGSFLFFVVTVAFIGANPLIALQIHSLLFKMVETVEWGGPR
jgi:hypothetical protein